MPAELGFSERKRTLCFTGHREKSVECYMNNPALLKHTTAAVRLMLCRYIGMAIESGYTTFVSGLAEGTDLWAADYVLWYRRRYPHIKLVGIMPYLGHSRYYSACSRQTLRNIELNADLLLSTEADPNMRYSSSGSSAARSLYRRRNCFMCDSSSAVIAYFNEGQTRSGTSQTINYARKQGLPVYSFGSREVFGILDKTGTDDMYGVKREISSIRGIIAPCL